MLGAGIGVPSGVALVAGYDFGPIALRISGGGWDKGWYGLQGDLAIHFSRAKDFSHGVSLIGGRLGTNPVGDDGSRSLRSQDFYGLTYDVYLAGFVLQVGLMFGKWDYASPDAVYQFGYVFAL